MKKLFHFLILPLILCNSVFAVIKPNYGGNAKISEDLTVGLNRIHLFEVRGETLIPRYPFSFVSIENRLEIDLSGWPDDRITELEKAIQALKDEANRCHWILDYPSLQHDHENSVIVAGKKLIITAAEQEFLQLIAQSSCMIPEKVESRVTLCRKQFGLEAKSAGVGGRPGLESF